MHQGRLRLSWPTGEGGGDNPTESLSGLFAVITVVSFPASTVSLHLSFGCYYSYLPQNASLGSFYFLSWYMYSKKRILPQPFLLGWTNWSISFSFDWVRSSDLIVVAFSHMCPSLNAFASVADNWISQCSRWCSHIVWRMAEIFPSFC